MTRGMRMPAAFSFGKPVSALPDDVRARPGRVCPMDYRYDPSADGVFIDALPVRFDMQAFLDRFLARWPAGSPAHAAYFRRIVDGPDHTIATAERPA